MACQLNEENGMNKTTVCMMVAALTAVTGMAQDFTFQDTQGKHLDVLQGGKKIARYMYAYDTKDKTTSLETYKPYLHVFSDDAALMITKGPGGDFTHHRGIFIGWNKLGFDGKVYDRWHMKGGEQVHQKFEKTEGGKDSGVFTSVVNWNDSEKQAIVVEKRTMKFQPAEKPGYVLIDFTSEIQSPRGDVVLDGDPEHAGIQYRPANEVDRSKTLYTYCGEKVDLKKDKDLAWIGETYTLSNKQYSVVMMNHPENPKGTRISAYRDYGRFGMFPKTEIAKGATKTFRYRFLISTGAMPEASFIQKACNAFTGRQDPVPGVTTFSAQPKK